MALKKIIFHIDVNSAFLSWEAAYRLHELGESLDIRTVPAAVGGDVSKRHGIILAKSMASQAKLPPRSMIARASILPVFISLIPTPLLALAFAIIMFIGELIINYGTKKST